MSECPEHGSVRTPGDSGPSTRPPSRCDTKIEPRVIVPPLERAVSAGQRRGSQRGPSHGRDACVLEALPASMGLISWEEGKGFAR